LSIEPILKYIQKQQIKWFAHLERISCDSIPYKAYIREERKKEEPEVDLGLIDNIKETLQEHQMTIVEAARKAKTRSLYTKKGIRGSNDRHMALQFGFKSIQKWF
jgi:hypothetical protein